MVRGRWWSHWDVARGGAHVGVSPLAPHFITTVLRKMSSGQVPVRWVFDRCSRCVRDELRMILQDGCSQALSFA